MSGFYIYISNFSILEKGPNFNIKLKTVDGEYRTQEHYKILNSISSGKYDNSIIEPNFYIQKISDRKEEILNDGVYFVGNGHIYNFTYLIIKYNIDRKYLDMPSINVIIPLFIRFGIEYTLSLVRGEFAFCLINDGIVYLARDALGIQPLFISIEDGKIILCSSMKGIRYKSKDILPGRIYSIINFKTIRSQYYKIFKYFNN